MRSWPLILVLAISAQAQTVVRFEADDGPPVRFIVPLGIEAPPDSAAAVRVVAALPAGVPEELAKVGRELRLEISTELVPGERAPETPAAYPKSRLVLPLTPLYPPSLHQSLRLQRGANKLRSPVIVAIADPRASIHYVWPPGANKRAAGCFNCDRSAHLIGKTEADGVYELFTNGRFVAVRPEPGVFVGTPYAFYGEHGRLELRVPTVLADTIRPPAVRVAANLPPLAGGWLQERTFLHSGELESSAVDLVAQGRAGLNVVLERTYRSSTLGLSPLGSGWDSALFRRLRALPDGSVEYRDGAEVWVFVWRNDQYIAPEGLFLRLTRSTSGWTLVDQQLRQTTFDDLGRMTSRSDEFFDAQTLGSGNTIHYLYGADSRLEKVIDPVGRQTLLEWDRATGLVGRITDWRSRTVEYEYGGARLSVVRLPEVVNSTGSRPRIEYGYLAAGPDLNEQLELAPNLSSMRDPQEAIASGPARVTFTYGDDRVVRQDWATGESATFAYSGTNVTVRDALGQERRYTVTQNDTTDLLADRGHVTAIRELAVPVWSGAAFGQLAASVTPGTPATSNVDRVQTFAFLKGVLQTSRLDGVGETVRSYGPAGAAPGVVLTASTTAGITRTFRYQSGGGFLQSVEAGGKTIEVVEPHRGNLAPTSTNSAVTTVSRYDSTGQLRAATSSGGTDPASGGAKEEIDYYPVTAPLHARGLPRLVRDGDDLETAIVYPGPTRSESTDPRGVVTTTDLDAWDRVVRLRMERPGDPMVLERTMAYDATGRVERITERKGPDRVVTSHTYDVLGRLTSSTTNGIATVGTMTTSTTYDLGARTISTTHPGGAVTRTEVDALGRVRRVVTDSGSSPVETQFAYDLADDRVFATDLFTATTGAFDPHGRVIASRAANGALTTTAYDEWDRPAVVKNFTRDGTETVAESAFTFTPAGQLLSLQSRLDATRQRETAFAWDGGGRTTRAATGGRVSVTQFDNAGRLLGESAGAGNLAALTDVFESTEVQAHDGALPARTVATERNGAAYTATAHYNMAGDAVRESVGSLEWTRTFDELGNLTAAALPARPTTHWDVDARGAVEKETLPDGAANQFAYDASGAQRAYEDPTSEATLTTRDRLGRPLTRTYPDGTTESVEWEGARVHSVVDRQGRIQTFLYAMGGEVQEIRDGANNPTDVFAYDGAGRLISWKTADTEVTWGDFDLAGHARETRQRRFRGGSGLTPNPALLDEVVQQHRWNEHGERTQFSMPVADGVVLGSGWTRWLEQSYDAVGNVTSIARIDDELATTVPVPVMSASYRGAGRPAVRTLVTSGGPLVRTYDYDPASSLLTKVSVTAKGVPIAGSDVKHDGLQTSEARMLGMASEERMALFAYDARSRVGASLFGVKHALDPTVPVPGSAREQLDVADYRNAQERTPALKAPAPGAAQVDPVTAVFAEKPGGGHKIDKVTQGPLVRPFVWNGAERVDDGRFLYTFDARGRLIRATEKSTLPPVRRALYTYTGAGRLVGRTVEYANVANPAPGDWKVEDRAQVLVDDGLPAETTFIWDPVTDRLVAVYRAGATNAPLKQIIHGQSAYDDPLETSTVDPSTGAVVRLYPIYDEAATGSLQSVLNAQAQVVARNLVNDPYGAHALALTGPAIDGAAIRARRSASGTLTEIDVELHATEAIAPATLARGVRLAALDAAGAVVRTATVTPSLTPDPYTVRWTLTGAEWTALTAPPAALLSVAATDHLRASTWSDDVPFMPAPEWATATLPVMASPEVPVEVRESLSSIAASLAAIPSDAERTTPLYEIPTLSLLGVSPRGTPLQGLLTAAFQALPFAEGLTGLVYARERWYDPGTGSFLSPDPLGYRDSANLYAFAGGDPVN
ncbi:MAG: RHS repeat-associated core domain-containing protein, partial [Acidobacteriota bacterium]